MFSHVEARFFFSRFDVFHCELLSSTICYQLLSSAMFLLSFTPHFYCKLRLFSLIMYKIGKISVLLLLFCPQMDTVMTQKRNATLL